LPEHLYEFHAPGDGEAVCLDLSVPGEEAWVVSAWPGAGAKTHVLFDGFGAWLMEAIDAASRPCLIDCGRPPAKSSRRGVATVVERGSA
jgi:hypothetical protein